MVKTPKFQLNAHNFLQNHSNLIKRVFLDSSSQDLSNDIKFDWFLGRPHFSILLVMTLLWRHFFCHMVFKFAYFEEGYQPAKFQCSRLSGSSFTEGLQKHNDDIMTTSLYIIGI